MRLGTPVLVLALAFPLAPPAGAAGLPPRKPLSAKQEKVMLAWARSYRSCMRGRGVALREPFLADRAVRFDLRGVEGASPRAALMRRTFACARVVGPPPGTLLLHGATLALFRAKTCPVERKPRRGR